MAARQSGFVVEHGAGTQFWLNDRVWRHNGLVVEHGGTIDGSVVENVGVTAQW